MVANVKGFSAEFVITLSICPCTEKKVFYSVFNIFCEPLRKSTVYCQIKVSNDKYWTRHHFSQYISKGASDMRLFLDVCFSPSNPYMQRHQNK